MHTQQPLQVLELADHVICRARCLLALLAHHAHAHVAVLDHDHIVSAVANAQRHLARLLLHQLYHFGLDVKPSGGSHLLLGEHAAEDHGVHLHGELHQRLHERLLALVRLHLTGGGDEGEHVARHAQREGVV